MPSSTPRLAPASGSILQFLLAGLPILIFLCYLLYLAHNRPSMDMYNVNDDRVRQRLYDTTDPIIPLLDMLYMFLAVELGATLLAAHVFVYLPKRRKLLRAYFHNSQTEAQCLGDVFVKARGSVLSFLASCMVCSGGNYGTVVYRHPDYSTTSSGSSSTNQILSSPQESQESTATTSVIKIHKRVRVFQNYTRERVALVRLLGHPFSAQPRTDLDMDLRASMRAVYSSRIVGYICLGFWTVFCVVSQFYLMHQMAIVAPMDAYENTTYGWWLVIGGGLIGIPLFSLLVTFVKWAVYKHGMVHKGSVVDMGNKTVETITQSDAGPDGVLVSKSGTDEEGQQQQKQQQQRVQYKQDAGLAAVFWDAVKGSNRDLMVPDDTSFDETNSVIVEPDDYIEMKDQASNKA